MPDLLTKVALHAERLPDAPALVGDQTTRSNRSLSWGELADRIDGWVAGFRSRDLQAGDRVGIAHYAGTLPVELYFATQAARLEPVLLGLGLAPHLGRSVSSLGIREIFCSSDVASAARELHHPTLVIWESGPGEDPYADAGITGSPRTWSEERAETVVSAIQYSTGTTGTPKGIVRSVGSDYYDAVNRCLGMRARHSERWICASPTNINVAIGASRCMALLGGTTIALDDVSPASIDENSRDGVTILPLQAPGWRELLDSGVASKLPERGLRVCVATGQRTPSMTLSRLRELMSGRGEVVNSYGLTETSTLAIYTSSMPDSQSPLSVGVPSALTTLEIAPRRGITGDPHGAGEIRVSGPAVFPGYLDEDGKLQSRLAEADTWFYTGDVGRWDSSGDLCVLGRWTDALICDGHYLFPYEIENRVGEFAAVVDAVVVQFRADQARTDIALVVEAGESPVSASDIRSALVGMDLPPLRILDIDSIPRNSSRKIDRAGLRNLIEENSPRLREVLDSQGAG
jgi:acyl-CoA synthetase (AMP-forming)/AMP-acid ligase II